ncbi:MAG TPA: DUF488 domain-containing protein [Pseudomonadales bacterium]
MRFYTVGHSTRPLEELIALLDDAAVRQVADVRTIPRSRRNPQFDSDVLAPALERHGIGYRHLRELGGLRPRRRDVPDAVNGFWQNRSFHNYADYALTDDFRRGLERLEALAHDGPCAMLCAEAVWWRCHRRIIADYLLARGRTVFHILGPGAMRPADPTPGAVVEPDGRVLYPAPA